MDIRNLGTDVVVEPVEVLLVDFAEVGLHAQLGIRPGATKEDVKAAYKKMVLKLYPDHSKNNHEKATELFEALNTTYQNRKGNTARTRQGGENQATPQPYHTHIQFNPTYSRSNFCGQNKPPPQQAQQQSKEKDGRDQEPEHMWSSWLWETRKS